MLMTPSGLQEALAARHPRTYGILPTPLHRLDRFSGAVGREVWIKRDDMISVGLGGNKIRKLRYLVADALSHGADHLVSVGAEQSNHARCVAATAAIEGMGCDLVLGGEVGAARSGNLLLDHLMGAIVHMPGTDDWQQLEHASHVVAQGLREAGKRPYVMPIGGSTPIGALGFIDGYLELRNQLGVVGVSPSSIVHATSSGGTQAGLAMGIHLCGDDIRLLGIGVAKTSSELRDEIVAIVDETLPLLGVASQTLDVTVVPGFVGRAYAEPTAGSLAALRLLLRTEGILVDPVYTAKALDAVMHGPDDLFGSGPVVFWHTGGMPAVFSPHYADMLFD